MADLNQYEPQKKGFSLTWLSSVLAALRDQESFLKRVHEATRATGQLIIVDFNLMNPVFLWAEWNRRRKALRESPEFGCHADFSGMLRRKGRNGALYYPKQGGGFFDDVQFFTPHTLGVLLRRVGFQVLQPCFSGFVPPLPFDGLSTRLEGLLPRVPVLKALGRAYMVTGVK